MYKAGPYQSGALMVLQQKSRVSALSANIRLGFKWPKLTDILACCCTELITAIKKFYCAVPLDYKNFKVIINTALLKAGVFVRASHFHPSLIFMAKAVAYVSRNSTVKVASYQFCP